ncbi:hypothetical protein NP233_g5837 [Leucocoprinus birnbaumii]|uniref:Uncharacterized protein n=1 Tax=Leucocoprinus birnbaumii TaxID=56174 RepID=A0AAD5VSG1_9AGAR|nr:hypothetical protein NP233_g5837 [Leucocoprinus birnbaumii]
MRSTAFLLPYVILALTTTPSLCVSLDYRKWNWKRSLSLWTRADQRNVPPEGYYDPNKSGGSMLTKIPVTFPMGQGEPINAIITGSSDSRVLVDAEVNGGLRNYFVSFGFSGECLGQHSGSDQEANLGDGNGYLNETGVIRLDYGDPQLGTCKETIQGGNHFRYWVQNGPSANSGAIFMAVSYEMPIAQQHDIIPDGYNLARDWLVGNITNSLIPTRNLTNTTTYTGTTSSEGYTYETNIRYVSGLLANTSFGINHNLSVPVDGLNAVDGLVAVLDVRITQAPPTSSAVGWHTTSLLSFQYFTCYVLLLSFLWFLPLQVL